MTPTTVMMTLFLMAVKALALLKKISELEKLNPTGHINTLPDATALVLENDCATIFKKGIRHSNAITSRKILLAA
jgi:hypothetical protein